MKLTTSQRWERSKRWLRRHYPLPFNCIVKLIPKLVDQAECEFREYPRPRKFIVRVCRERSFELRVEGLLHEWAHCMTWFGLDDKDHGEVWSIVYGRLYDAHCNWDYGRKRKPKEDDNQ